MSSSNQTLVAETDEPKAVESEPVPVPTEQNLGGNTEEGVVGVEDGEEKVGSFGTQGEKVEETEKTQLGEDGNSGAKLDVDDDDDDDDEKSGEKQLGGGVISGDRVGDREEETASGGKDGVVGAAIEENKVEEEVKEEEDEVAVSEVKEDGQNENEGVVQEVNKPEIVVSEEVTGTAGTVGTDTFVANGVEGSEVLGEESGVLEGGSENLIREIEAENENENEGKNDDVVVKGDELEEPSTENEVKNDDRVVKGDELEEPSIKFEGKNDDVVVKGDELEELSTENEGKNDDAVVKGDELEEPSIKNEGKNGDAVVKGDELEEPSIKNEGKNGDVVVKGDEAEEAREAEDAGNYEAALTGDELEEDEMENPELQPARIAILEKTEAEEIMREIEEANTGIDGQLGSDSDEEMEGGIEFEEDDEDDEEDDREDEEADRESFDSALAALLKAATGGGDGNFVITPQDDSSGSGTGSRIFKIDRPAGLGPSAPALRPRPAGTTPARPSSQLAAVPSDTGTAEEMSEEEKALHEKIESIRVKFLRLVHRSGHSPEDTVARQVLHRLSLAEGFRRGRVAGAGIGIGTSIEAAWKKALQLEAISGTGTGTGTDDLKFSVNILVLGKAGVGKSATINSIFNSEVASTDPFSPVSTSVREFTRTVDGIKFRVIDTPGLKTSIMDQNANRKILARVKSVTKKCPPDIVLYVDRIDTQTRDLNDLPLLRTITSVLGSSIWFNAIVALTHAGLAPPEGPNGSPLTYESFVAQRSHVVQLAVRQGAGDMRLMNPVALVENHPSCRRNRDGHKILPNGQSWRQQLLLLCYSSKILSEANELLKLQDNSSSAANKLFGFRFRSPPLPFLLSSLLQTRAHPKLANDQGGDVNGDSDVELDDFSDYEEEDEDEYDQLPPFKPLRKSQIAKLSSDQKKAYFEEYEYRVKLLQKKQWREEVRRMKEMKRRKEMMMDSNPMAGFEPGEDYDDENENAPASVQVPLPDMVLPPSFDADAPTYRYRFLEPTSGLLARPVLDTHGWDHDCGYDGVSLEETLALVSKFPANVSAQITKDKKEFSIHLESAVSAKHGDNGSSLAGFDIQTIGRQLGYIIRGETKFKNLKRNKTTGGITVTFLGDIVAAGAKLEDQLTIGKRLTLVGSTGGVRAQGDIAYGANLEARLRDKDYPIGQALTTLGLSLMKWRGDLALGANLQSQIPVGNGSKVALRIGLNNKLSGQISVRTSTSDHFQIAFLALVPVVSSIIRTLRTGGGGGGESFAY